MKRLFVPLALLMLCAVGSVLAQDVRYNFDKDTDFSKLKTYKWVVLKDAKQLDDLQEKQVKTAVEAQLAQKGLTKTDGDNADLYIGYQAAIGQEKEFTSYNTGWGYGPGWYGGGWYGPGGGFTSGQTSTIYVGQLSIDMYNPAGHALIWRGVVSKELDPKAKPEKREKNLNKAMTKLFKNFPPKAKS